MVDQNLSICLGQTIVFHVAFHTLIWQFRQHIPNGIQHFICKVDLQNIRFREIPIVMCVFLASHGRSFALVFIKTTGFLHNFFAGIQQSGLPLDLIIDGTGNRFQRVHVFDLCTSTQFPILRTHNRNIDIAAERTFFHFTVTDTSVLQQEHNLFNESLRFFCGRNIRLCNDFYQRDTTTVVVCQRNGVEVIVHQFSGIFFQVDMVDSDILLSVRGVNSNFAFQTKRIIQLGNLICLRQVRIEVVLSVKNRKLADVAAQCHTSLYRIFYSSLVDDRQCARHTGADRTAAGVLASAEFCTTGTKNFGFGQELRMDFQTNNRNI